MWLYFVVIFFFKNSSLYNGFNSVFLIPSWNQLQGHRKPRRPSSSTIWFLPKFFSYILHPLRVFVIIVCFLVGQGMSGTYLYLGLFSIFFIFTLFQALVSTFSILPLYHFKEMEAFFIYSPSDFNYLFLLSIVLS